MTSKPVQIQSSPSLLSQIEDARCIHGFVIDQDGFCIEQRHMMDAHDAKAPPASSTTKIPSTEKSSTTDSSVDKNQRKKSVDISGDRISALLHQLYRCCARLADVSLAVVPPSTPPPPPALALPSSSPNQHQQQQQQQSEYFVSRNDTHLPAVIIYTRNGRRLILDTQFVSSPSASLLSSGLPASASGTIDAQEQILVALYRE